MVKLQVSDLLILDLLVKIGLVAVADATDISRKRGKIIFDLVVTALLSEAETDKRIIFFYSDGRRKI